MNPSLPRCLATSLDGSSEWDNHADIVKVARVGKAPLPPRFSDEQDQQRALSEMQGVYYGGDSGRAGISASLPSVSL
ncbi:hypothetical protein XPA_001648 [Xanthoria parietina]